MTTADEIRQLIRGSMDPDKYCKSGAVLLTGNDSLRPANVYIMGLNPGGDPSRITGSIIDSIVDRQHYSSYINECWQPKCPGGACEHMSGQLLQPMFLVKHQRNMITLAETLGTSPADLFSANAVFARSTSRARLTEQTGYSLDQWWDACWPVHQRFLAIIRPKMIISLGYSETSSAFGLLRRQAGRPPFRRIGDDSRRGGWTFDGEFGLGDDKLGLQVVGIPHPSYMAIGPDLGHALRGIAELEGTNP